MAELTQNQFLDQVHSQIKTYLYGNFSASFDRFVQDIQDASGEGTMNWHKQENKDKFKAIFEALNDKVDLYTLNDGDFRTYLLLNLVTIVDSTYQTELLKMYLRKGYNIAPESAITNLDNPYSERVSQNTSLPDQVNTSSEVSVQPTGGGRLVPNAVYSD